MSSEQIGLRSEMFSFFLPGLLSPRTVLSQRQGRHDCGFNAEMRESTPDLSRGVINRSRSEAARISSRLKDQLDGCLLTSNERHA